MFIFFRPMYPQRFLYRILFLAVICIFTSGAFAQQRTDSAKASPDTLHTKLIKAHAALNKAGAGSKKIAEPKTVRADLGELKKKLEPIRKELQDPKKIIDSKTLNAYNLELKRSQEKIGSYRKSLSRSAGNSDAIDHPILKFGAVDSSTL